MVAPENDSQRPSFELASPSNEVRTSRSRPLVGNVITPTPAHQIKEEETRLCQHLTEARLHASPRPGRSTVVRARIVVAGHTAEHGDPDRVGRSPADLPGAATRNDLDDPGLAAQASPTAEERRRLNEEWVAVRTAPAAGQVPTLRKSTARM